MTCRIFEVYRVTQETVLSILKSYNEELKSSTNPDQIERSNAYRTCSSSRADRLVGL